MKKLEEVLEDASATAMVEGRKEDAPPAQQPATSSSTSATMTTTSQSSQQDDEEQANSEDLNKALEEFASTYNLTAHNVKNIIFHIVKNPQTFATLVRRDPDALAGLHMTRSCLRQLERIARARIPSARLRPIGDDGKEPPPPQGEDADATPKKDKVADEGDAKEGEEDQQRDDDSLSASSSEATTSSSSDDEAEGEGKKGENEEGEEREENALMVVEEDEEEEGKSSRKEGTTAQAVEVDNLVYPLFVVSALGDETVLDPAIRHQIYGEDDDSDYMFKEFDEFCEQEEHDEFRKDRATEISRREMKWLEQQFDDDYGEDGPTPLDVPIEPARIIDNQEVQQVHGQQQSSSCWFSRRGQREGAAQHDQQPPPPSCCTIAASSTVHPPTTSSTSTDAFTQTLPPAESSEVSLLQAASSSSSSTAAEQPPSCSLLKEASAVRFTVSEMRALQVQLEKHVQLLCQAIVGTSQDEKLVGPRNRAMLMLRELDELSREREDQHSLFNVPTLEAAIYSAHDIQACRKVNLALPEHNERQPSNETMWVLARSGAIRYPDLLCPYHFAAYTQPHARFLPSEQLLFALGLYQLHYVPHYKRSLYARGRYPLINQHFLPNKTVAQIRYHLKNVHCCPSPSIYHCLMLQADKGTLPFTYRPDLGASAQSDKPIEWPDRLQPYWLKWLSSLMRQCQTQMFVMDDDNVDDDVSRRRQQQPGPSSSGSNNVIVRMDTPTFLAATTPATTGGLLNASSGSGPLKLLLPSNLRHRQPNVEPNKGTTTAAAGSGRKRPIRRDEGDVEQQQQVELEDGDEPQHQNEGGAVTAAGRRRGQRRRKRLRTASSTTTTGAEADEEAGGEGGGGAGTTAGGEGQPTTADETSNEQFMNALSAEEVPTDQQAAAQPMPSMGKADEVPSSAQPKKSRRKQRAEQGLEALCDPQAREQTARALVQTLYEDFKKRMFMHQDKLRSVQRVLAHADLVGMAQCFTLLWDAMGGTHPQLFYLFAAIATPEHALPHALRLDPKRLACKRALRMLQTIYTYMGASRSAVQMKNTLKFLKEANKDITTEQQLFELLQRHFGGLREEPLWKLVRREWMGARFADDVEDWQFECMDMEKLSTTMTMDGEGQSSQQLEDDDELLRYEHLRMLYRHDPTERSRLRVRHGRVTVELGGRLRAVTINCIPSPSAAADPCSAGPSGSSTTITTSAATTTTAAAVSEDHEAVVVEAAARAKNVVRWSREMDAALLTEYNRADGQRQQCVARFTQLAAAQKQWPMLAEDGEGDPCAVGGEVARRLQTLLDVAHQLKGRQQQQQRDDDPE